MNPALDEVPQRRVAKILPLPIRDGASGSLEGLRVINRLLQGREVAGKLTATAPLDRQPVMPDLHLVSLDDVAVELGIAAGRSPEPPPLLQTAHESDRYRHGPQGWRHGGAGLDEFRDG